MRDILLITAIALIPTIGYSADIFYGKALVGYGINPHNKLTIQNRKESITLDSKGKGKLGSIAVGFGYNIRDNVRGDLELYADDGIISKKQIKNNTVKSAVQTYAGFLNAHYDFKNNTNCTPFISAGVGYAANTVKINTKHKSYDDTTKGIAYQVGLGASYRITPKVSAEVSYRYIDKGLKTHIMPANKNMLIKTDKSSGQLHAVLIGTRVSF